MNPHNPGDAQRIVASYLQMLDEHASANVYPGSVRDLPLAKETIRAAFKTSTMALLSLGQLTSDMRDYLEVAYVSLADYQDDECVALLREYVRAAEELEAESRAPRERTATATWHRLSEQSRLAGQIAKEISAEAERLRQEFRSWSERAAVG
jgi:hypothetical protein